MNHMGTRCIHLEREAVCLGKAEQEFRVGVSAGRSHRRVFMTELQGLPHYYETEWGTGADGTQGARPCWWRKVLLWVSPINL